MSILLLGSQGMLGQALKKCLVENNCEVIGVDRVDSDYCFDVLNDEKLYQCVDEVRPDIIINTIAVIDLLLCEKEPGTAYCLNGRFPGILANICKKYNSYFIHISTDHFYSGDGDYPHKECDPLNIVNEYARTKYLGEIMALSYEVSLVLRTNIVGFRGSEQPTFVEWIINEIKHKNRMTLFPDFYTSSISVTDFSEILMKLIQLRPTGVYNLASSEVSNKKDFILALSKELFDFEPDYVQRSVMDISSIPRGNSLGLNTSKVESLLNFKMPTLQETIKSIKQEYWNRIK